MVDLSESGSKRRRISLTIAIRLFVIEAGDRTRSLDEAAELSGEFEVVEGKLLEATHWP